jgi:hypothetical protein
MEQAGTFSQVMALTGRHALQRAAYGAKAFDQAVDLRELSRRHCGPSSAWAAACHHPAEQLAHLGEGEPGPSSGSDHDEAVQH